MMGQYGCYNTDGELMYVGSSTKELSKLEWNHRNYYKFPDGYESNFRKALLNEGQRWTFKWIQQPRNISRLQAEIEEGVLIRLLKPKYNKDQYPYETSVRRGRMEKV